MDVTHHLDIVTATRAQGWAFARDASEVRVQVWEQDRCIAEGPAEGARPDVANAYAQYPQSGQCGFDIAFDLACKDPLSQVTVRLVMQTPAGETESLDIASRDFITAAGLELALAGTTGAGAKSAFPGDVASLVSILWPGAPVESHLEEDQHQIADKILYLASQRSVEVVAPVIAYVRFLREAWAHFQFVARYFPATNANRTPQDKDYSCTPNSPAELFTIAHHLYVLKSHGVEGAFAEFGCFKGFSTAMLSHVCRLIDVQMHVFDSFAGLPRSDSAIYEPGEFAGSLKDVSLHVATFGAPERVIFHEGYFSDTLPSFDMPKLLALWMDVDLESSATDVMTVFDRLDPRSAVFSHECEPAHFDGDRIAWERDPNAVIPPIVDAFERSGQSPRGRFLDGATGAFWRQDTGLPVLAAGPLHRLLAGI